MKFGDYLKSIEREAPDEYRGRWLKYKQLKKNIKQCKRGRAETSWSDLSSAEKEFFQELQREVREVNRQFESLARKLIAARTKGGHHGGLLSRGPFRCFSAMSKHLPDPKQVRQLAVSGVACRDRPCSAMSKHLTDPKQAHRLAEQAHWCREYAKECWTFSEPGHGTFLHSPLLDELKALEKILDEKQGQTGDDEYFTSDTEPASSRSAAPETLRADRLAALASTEAVQESLHGSMVPPTVAPSMNVSAHGVQDMEADSEERAPAGLVPAAAMGGVGDAAVNPSLAAAAASGAAGQAAGEAGGGEEAVVRHKPHGRGVEIVQHWLAGIDDADTSGLLSDPDMGMDAEAQRHAESVHPSTLHKAPSIGSDDDNDWTCSICLGILYKPIGLSCGHKFCRPCALRAAGMSKVLGKVKAILDNIPAETKCPECRQMWVYSGAIQLKSVDEFVRSRSAEAYMGKEAGKKQHLEACEICQFAEAYQEKEAEEKKRIQDLKAEIKRHDQEVQDFSYGLYVSRHGRAGRPAEA
eukprot:jgi/Astpho2/5309/fgenesh1_pg.00075_%23_8_t